MQQPKIKPAAVLDDDAHWAQNIARSIRRFGGMPVKYFPSIEVFLRNHKLEIDEHHKLAKVLGEYSGLVFDNNFEAQHENPRDGWIRGADFLIYTIGPTISAMERADRPLVMSFAPSSESVIRQYEEMMWKKYEIVSFHKMWETAAIGLSFRITAENGGIVLSRKALIENVCQQNLADDEYGSPKADFFFNLRAEHCEFDGTFSNESFDQVEGKAKPMRWDDIVNSLASRLGIQPQKLALTIENEVNLRRAEIEGNGGRQRLK